MVVPSRFGQPPKSPKRRAMDLRITGLALYCELTVEGGNLDRSIQGLQWLHSSTTDPQ